MSGIEIIPAKSLGSFLTFSKVPRLIYSGRKGFAPMLDAERWTLYGAKLNPHFNQVDSETWLARKAGRIVGRILAQVYKDGVVPLEASPAQFGCLDCIEDEAVVSALLTT